MQPDAESVVPETIDVSEAEFLAALLTGLSRCAKYPTGKRRLASAMDLSSKGLENILLKGAMPNAKRQWDALGACPTALDDVAALYGIELVRKMANGEIASLGTLPLASLLAAVAEAESPASHGGTHKTHQELLAMEDRIREVHALTGEWLNEISRLRGPRRVANGCGSDRPRRRLTE